MTILSQIAKISAKLPCERCEGLPGVYSTIWYLYYKTNKLKKRREKEGDRPS
jgi:hypothetical protein